MLEDFIQPPDPAYGAGGGGPFSHFLLRPALPQGFTALGEVELEREGRPLLLPGASELGRRGRAMDARRRRVEGQRAARAGRSGRGRAGRGAPAPREPRSPAGGPPARARRPHPPPQLSHLLCPARRHRRVAVAARSQVRHGAPMTRPGSRSALFLGLLCRAPARPRPTGERGLGGRMKEGASVMSPRRPAPGAPLVGRPAA